MSFESSRRIIPLQVYDPEQHAIISARGTSAVQDRMYFHNSRLSRPDLNTAEHKRWMDGIIQGDRLRTEMAKYIVRQGEVLSMLSPDGFFRLSAPLRKEQRQMKLYRSFANSFNPGWSVEDADKMSTWYDKIESRIDKYELRYPNLDVDTMFGIVNKEPYKIFERQNAVTRTMTREMGIDHSIFEGDK